MKMPLSEVNAWIEELLPLALWMFSIVWMLSCALYVSDQISPVRLLCSPPLGMTYCLALGCTTTMEHECSNDKI